MRYLLEAMILREFMSITEFALSLGKSPGFVSQVLHEERDLPTKDRRLWSMKILRGDVDLKAFDRAYNVTMPRMKDFINQRLKEEWATRRLELREQIIRANQAPKPTPNGAA